MSGTPSYPTAYPALFAQPKGFSEYVGDVTKYSQTSDPSISANPSINRVSRAIDGVRKTHLTISDLARTKILPETIRIYSEKYGGALNFLTSRFNTIVTDQRIWEIESVKTHRDLWALAVMNTTAPVISFEFHSQSGSTTFTQEGVAYDSYALMKPEAVKKLDYEIGAVNAHIIAHHAVVATVAILQAYSSFARSAIFCSYMSNVITPLTAFQNMARLHSIFTKSEFACTDVFGQCDRIFGSRGFRELITSRESALAMLMNSDINLKFYKSGEGAVAAQQRVDIPVTVMGKRITALPVVDPAPQNNSDARYLSRECQTITIAPFYDRTRRVAWDKFRTNQTDIEYISYKTDDWDRYSKSNAIWNLPWFHNKEDLELATRLEDDGNLTAAKEIRDKIGELDLTFLQEFADDLSIEYNNTLSGQPMTRIPMAHRPFELAGTGTDGQAIETSTLLTRLVGPEFLDDASTKGSKSTSGSSDVFSKGRFIPCKTIGELPRQNVKTEYLDQIIRQVEKEFAGADFDKTANRIFHKHPALKTTVSGFVASMLKLADTDRAGLLKNAQGNLAFAPEKETNSAGISVLAERLRKYRGSTAAVLYLTQPLDAVFFEKCARNNINIPLGVVNFRLESRLMRSMIATSQDGNGKFGTAFTTGIQVADFDKTTVHSGEHKQGVISIGSSYGAAVVDSEMLCPLLNVQGSHVLQGCGGNGNEYFPQRSIKLGLITVREIRGLLATGRSNFAVLTSANSMIEETFPLMTSICGYFLAGDFQQFLDNHPEFGKNRRTPLYPGQHLFMYANPFFDRTPASIGRQMDPNKISFNDLIQLRNHSYLAGLGSIRMWSHASTDRVVTAETHLDGPRLPGSRKRDQGQSVVGLGVKESTGLFTGRKGLMIGAGGVQGKRQRLLENL